MEIFKDKKTSKKSKSKSKEEDEEPVPVNNIEDDDDTELAIMPMRHFTALITNKDDVIDKYDEDRIKLAGELRGTKERLDLYMGAHDKEKKQKDEYKKKCECQEKELETLKTKTKHNPKVDDVISKSKKSIITMKDHEKSVDDYYKKYVASGIEALRLELESGN